MLRALALARRGMGGVRPNPPVGAVVVQDGRIVGEGYHRAAGDPHAEVAALAAAGEAARGATMYVTLEPCNHVGRTPPCSRALLDAGIARVHIARHDPNLASGRGAEALRAAGVDVRFGPGEREASHLLAGFGSWVERGRPRITLKMAASLDGRIATAGGDSRWISGAVARAWAHRRRREADAILVGSGTVAKDNPQLTVRHVKGRNPDRIVVDSTLRLSPKARVYDPNGPRRIVAAAESAGAEAEATLRDRGVEVWRFPARPDGRIPLRALAEKLGAEGYTHVLCEGGARLAGGLFAEHLVDQAWLVMSRRLLLGSGGPGWLEGLEVPAVARALRVARTDLRSLGGDWLVTLVPEAAQWWDPETLGAPAVAAAHGARG